MAKIDIEQIAQELDFDCEDIEMLMEVFIESANEQLLFMHKGIEKNDFDMIYKAAHTIKGSAGNLLLRDISSLAKQIELDARKRLDKDYMSEYLKLEEAVKTIKY